MCSPERKGKKTNKNLTCHKKALEFFFTTVCLASVSNKEPIGQIKKQI